MSIPINGLVWMGHSEHMLKQFTEKIYDGFTCLKMKIGGIDFDLECDILDYIRRRYYNKELTIRLDANGAFDEGEALNKIQRLAKFNIHSIEQPLAVGDSALPELINDSSIPIALDEELIPAGNFDERIDLLEKLKPRYLVLKPSLLGGFRATNEWIQLAEQRNIKWWITSALESNIGLNAIAQFTSTFDNNLHQGLGTGKLYENNIPSPLTIKGESIIYDLKKNWDLGMKTDE